jgi:murein DD-endopeptidase MepM/ murein hydrolase activator NlpD
MSPSLWLPRATTVAIALSLISVTAASAAAPVPAPTPSASPTTANNCAVNPAFRSDPLLKALEERCKADLAAINGNKSKLQDSIAMAQGSAQGLDQMLKQTREAIEASRKKQEEIRAKIRDLEQQQQQTLRQIEETKVRLGKRRAEYAAFMRRDYKFAPQLWASLFESEGISDFLSRATAVVQVQAFGREILLAVKAEERRLDEQQAKLNRDHDETVRQHDQLVRTAAQLMENESKQTAILAELQGSITDAQGELKNAATRTAALFASIVAAQIARENQLIQAANDAAWQAAQVWMAANSATFPVNGTHSTKYPFVWPAQIGVISQGFGPSDLTLEPPGFGAPHFHAGVDVAAESGTPIFSADDGIVVSAQESLLNGVLIGYGRHVVIAHKNGALALYGHLNAYSVKVGQQVHQGDLIGLMGTTGMSTGSHLHFELRANNVPIDPLPYLPQPGPSAFKE